METFVKMLGDVGIIGLTGLMVFLFSFKHSHAIFDWIERQTLGTRTYIMEKLELMFIEVKPEHVTYFLLFISIGLGSIVFLLFGVVGKWVLGFFLGMMVSFAGFKIPKPFIDNMYERRINAYGLQMVDALQLLSNGIRAGLSMPQAIGMIVDEMPAPISQEFNMILQQNKIGVPLEECLDNLAQRVPTQDNDMFVASVNILRETGGNLAEVFDTIVHVIRERVRLRQKIETYVAQGMFQGATIFCMPFAIGMIYYVSDPDSMMLMFTTPVGWAFTIGALILDIIGGIIILKIVKIEV
ncbi:MAG: type II secretion system F family protein [Bacteriovoracaceae bacterium]|nr:type II secretion system F family protein [Bacteriovoracaceae bacterium]